MEDLESIKNELSEIKEMLYFFVDYIKKQEAEKTIKQKDIKLRNEKYIEIFEKL